MKYLTEEETIIVSDDKSLTLTTHRISLETKNWGESHFASIMLEKISSIEVKYHSWVVVLIIGVIALIFGIGLTLVNDYQIRKEVSQFSLIAGGVCILLFFLSRHHVITITSDGGTKISFSTKGMKKENVFEFVDKIEQAKNERFLNCYTNKVNASDL